MATDITFLLLSMLLWLKPVPVEVTVPGIYEANVLNWLQIHQTFP
jgi:hypothetical protein